MNDTYELILQVIGALIVIIPLAYLATRMYARRSGFGTSRRSLQLLEITSLGTGKALYLVEIPGQRLLVLGVTAQQIRVLAEIDDPQIVGEVRSARTAGMGAEGFASILRRVDRQFDGGTGEKEKGGDRSLYE